MGEKERVLEIVEKLDKDKKSKILNKLKVCTIEEAISEMMKISGKRVFIHFKDRIVDFSGIEYINILPELKTASAILTPEKLLEILLDDRVIAVELVPEIKFSSEK